MQSARSVKKVLVFILFISISFASYGIYRSPEAGRYYYWMFSPELLSRSMGVVGTSNPSGIVINPSSLAFVQRVKIEASYGITPGIMPWLTFLPRESFVNAGDFFWPFMINAGGIIPSKFGNFTIYANYMNMSNLGFNFTNNNDLGIGKIGAIYFGFSKDYSDILALGISGNLKFSYNPLLKPGLNNNTTPFDIGGGIDLGFIWKPEVYLPFSERSKGWAFQDLEFAVTLKDIGKPLINFPKENQYDLPWFPNPFTAAAGISFNLYNDSSTYWKILADVTTPFFQNLTISLGTEVQIVKFLVLRTSYTFDLEGVLEYAKVIDKYGYIYNIANVGFGLSFKIRSDMFKKQSKDNAKSNKHKSTSFSIDIGARPYHQGFIFEAGFGITIGVRDETPPEIDFIQNDIYASPNLDGIQDEIIIDLDIKDDRYVIFWKFELSNKSGKIVKIIESKEKRKEGMKARDVIKKYFAPKSGIPIPKKVIWDGRDDHGDLVPDGTYTFKFYAMDDNKNIDENGSREGAIVIDTEKPQVKSNVSNKIFSPNDDGSKDMLIIDIEIVKEKIENTIEEIDVPEKIKLNKLEIPETINSKSDNIDIKKLSDKEQFWMVEILDSADNIIKSYKYNEKGKKRIEWDGKDENGNKMPDGIYTVKIHSTDEAGNYWEEAITNIIIDTIPTPIEAAVLNNIFSPNNDNASDLIDFQFDIPIKKGIERWDFNIIDSKNKVVKVFKGEKDPVLELSWDGKDENDIYLPEGTYSGKLIVIYENGNIPEGITPDFSIDVTHPFANVMINKNIFSPNGDGNIDEVNISHTASEEDEWKGNILDNNDKKLKSFVWKNLPPKTFYWDGKDDKNLLLDDGTYYYQLSSTDTAGNYFETEKKEIKIFTKETPVFITSAYESFSPNNDRVQDIQKFEIHAKISEDNKVTKWQMNIFDDNDKLTSSFKKGGDLLKNLTWDGRNITGYRSPDGYYYASFTADFESGQTSESRSQLFTLDTVVPTIEIKAKSNIFSPNNDSNLDSFEILQKGSAEEQWSQEISDAKNNVIWTKYYKGEPVKIEKWNGKDKNGNIQKNGFFKYVIKSKDNAGNTGKAVIDKFELKNIHTSAYIVLKDSNFSPNNDKRKDVFNINTYVTEKEGVDLYKLEILNDKKEIVRTFKGEKEIPKNIIWDGKNDKNEILKDGIYMAKLSAIYNFGNRPKAESSKFILDTTPPVIELKYDPKYFSPDNDGNDDMLSIYVNSKDITGIKDWKISILEPTKKEFKSFNGKGKPTNKIRWNGLSNKGELAESAEDYPVKVYAEDKAGNILNKIYDPIMIDILVIKLSDGRLKIKISNIEFKPNSPEMTDTDKNKKILNLIAKALRKYRKYKITVEGHANKYAENLNEKKAKSLSDERAKIVVEELNKRGISSKRVTIIGRGFDIPLIPLSKNVKPEDLAKNRRVEFYLDKD